MPDEPKVQDEPAISDEEDSISEEKSTLEAWPALPISDNEIPDKKEGSAISNNKNETVSPSIEKTELIPEQKPVSRAVKTLIVIGIITFLLFVLYSTFFKKSPTTTEQRYLEQISLPEYMRMSRSEIPRIHTSEIFSRTKYSDDTVVIRYDYASISEAESDLNAALQFAGYKQISRDTISIDIELSEWRFKYTGSGNQTCAELYVYHTYYKNLDSGKFSLECVLR